MPEEQVAEIVTPTWLKITTWLLLITTGIILIILFFWWQKYFSVLKSDGISSDTSSSMKRQDLKLNGTELSLSNGNSVDLSGVIGNLASQLQPAVGPQGPAGNTGINGSTGTSGASGGVGVAYAQNGVVLAGSTLEMGVNPLLHNTSIPQGGYDLYLDASANNGSLIAVGAFADVLSLQEGPGNPISISGPGNRLFWYPKKVALRAGEIDDYPLDFSPYGGNNFAAGTLWDDANIGLSSMAIGYDVAARGPLSVAIGALSDVEGQFSTSLGAFNVIGPLVADPDHNYGNGGTGNIALGGLNQMNGTYSASIGLGRLNFFGPGTCFTKTEGDNSFNVGECNDLESNHSTAIGKNNVVGEELCLSSDALICPVQRLIRQENIFVVGNDNNVTAPDVLVLGESNTVTGNGFAALIGKSSGISGENSLGMGVGIQINGDKSFAIGQNLTIDATADNSFGLNVDDTTPVTMSNANVIGLFGGKVGINQANPTHRFEVTDTSTDTTAAFTGTTQTCIVDTSGPGGWNCTSDERLKTNIVTLNDSLDTIMQLRGVTYNFRSSPDSAPIAGFIAQEVQKILPDLVGKDVNGYLNLNKEGMIPYIVSAIQEQNGKLDQINKQLVDKGLQLDTLTADLKKLSGVVDDHEQRIDALEAEVKELKKQQIPSTPPSSSVVNP